MKGPPTGVSAELGGGSVGKACLARRSGRRGTGPREKASTVPAPALRVGGNGRRDTSPGCRIRLPLRPVEEPE